MSFVPVNPYQKPTQKQIFQLFWFSKMIVHHENPNFDYLRDFHITETLICSFNGLVSAIPINEGNTRKYLFEAGLQNVDDADVKNVLMSIQVSLKTQTIDVENFGDINIRQTVTYYVEWFNYINYMYSIDFRYQAKPVIWNKRKRYNAYKIMQLERGALMESFIENEFRKYGIDIGFYYTPDNQWYGESRLGLEIKHDMMSWRTGNYYIECYEACNSAFYKSGIFKSDNTIFWLIGTMNEYYIVYKDDLRRLYNSINPHCSGWQNGKKLAYNDSSRGFIIKKSVLQRIAIARSVQEFVTKYLSCQRLA